MTNTEKREELRKLIGRIADGDLDDVISIISARIADKNPPTDPPQENITRPKCPHCHSSDVFRNGFTAGKNRKQRYLCKVCAASFVQTTGTALFGSHCAESAWDIAVRDTVAGVSLEETAKALKISHSTAFNMRHKILRVLEEESKENPTILGQGSEICELDETFVLESFKGTKMPENYWRRPRKHGSKAASSGLSNEQICICTGIDASHAALANTVNRSIPTGDELMQVFQGRINPKSVALTDGGKGYPAMAKRCGYKLVNVGTDESTCNLNRVNGFHSFIKYRYLHRYHGLATKYLNRYNTLFAKIYANKEAAIASIIDLVKKHSIHISTADVRSRCLLYI